MTNHDAEIGAPDPDLDRGLYGKFRVERVTPSTRGIDHDGCRYFVLDPQHDPAALAALARYAQVVRADGFGPLADDLEAWVESLLGPECQSCHDGRDLAPGWECSGCHRTGDVEHGNPPAEGGRDV